MTTSLDDLRKEYTRMEHTPGPWHAYEAAFGFWSVRSSDGVRVAKELGDADARLIASAPALLAALEALVDSFTDKTRTFPELDAARATLESARGPQ